LEEGARSRIGCTVMDFNIPDSDVGISDSIRMSLCSLGAILIFSSRRRKVDVILKLRNSKIKDKATVQVALS